MRHRHDLNAWFETALWASSPNLHFGAAQKSSLVRSDAPRRVSNHARSFRILSLAVLATLISATPALAQDRTPGQRQALTDLAYVLGQSHALRQACQGATDQFWRGRMLKMVEAEAPDPAFDTRLHNAFNAGFSSAQAQYPACGPDSRRAEAAAAAHGQALASSLAKPMADDQSVR